VSTLASLAAKWLLPRLSAFQEAHPGIDVRITTRPAWSTLGSGDVDAAIRYGRGLWPGLRADWLWRTSCFRCAARRCCGQEPLRQPEDLADHVLLHSSAGNDETGGCGSPRRPAGQPFEATGRDLRPGFMTIQAAIDGIGVAMGRTSYVEADIARAALSSRSDRAAGGRWLLTRCQRQGDTPKLSAFRQWLISIQAN